MRLLCDCYCYVQECTIRVALVRDNNSGDKDLTRVTMRTTRTQAQGERLLAPLRAYPVHRFAPIQCIDCTASLLSSASIAPLRSHAVHRFHRFAPIQSLDLQIACIRAPEKEAFLC